MGNPCLFLAPLNGSLAFQDRAGGGTLTGSGAVRYQAANGARTNFVKNPHAEVDLTAIQLYQPSGGSALTSSTEQVRFGSRSAKCVTTIAGPSGPIFNSSPIGHLARTWSAVFWVYFPVGVSFDVYLNVSDATGAYLGSPVSSIGNVGTGAWQSVTISGTIATAGMHFILPVVYCSTPGTFYVGGVLLENTLTPGAYFDGSTGAWLDPITGIIGTAHASPSVSQAAAWVEEGTTNTVPDPSFEAAVITTNWSAAGAATISKVTTHAYVGSNGGKVSCTASTSDGIDQLSTSGSAASNGQPWTVSGRIRAFAAGDVGKTVKPQIVERTAADASVLVNLSSAITLTDAWQPFSYTVTLSGGGTVAKVTHGFRAGAAVAVDFVLDAVQLEQKAYATSFCDGSIGTGYSWSGTAHASTSTRTATTITAGTAGRISATSGSVLARAKWGQTNPTNAFAFAMNTGAAERVYLNRNNLDKLILSLGSSTPLITESGTTADDSWVSVLGDWDGSVGRLFKDNVQLGVNSAYSGLTTPDATMGIGGQNSGATPINGLVNNVAIYNRPLTPAERNRLNAASVVTWNTIRGRRKGALTPM